jgi:hypothetical protein
VLEDFKQALARVQSDYQFYIECQTRPAVALAGYDLSADERSTLSDPDKLAEVLKGGVVSGLRGITVTISGKHDWINRAAAMSATDEADRGAKVAREVEAIKGASTGEERTEAAFRLMEQIG